MLNLNGRTSLETLAVPANPKPLSQLTRVVVDRKDGYKLILDNGSAPLVLDTDLACRDVRAPKSKIEFKYGTTKLQNIRVGKSAIELFTPRDIGRYDALCVDGLKDKIGAAGVVGLAPAGPQSCLSDEDSCAYPESEFAVMNKGYYHGFEYRTTSKPYQRVEQMVPIKAVGPKAEFKPAKNSDNLKIMYTSTKRDNGDNKENPYSILELGWPPEFNKILPGGKPCYHGAQFFGAGEISDLKVDYSKNLVGYSLHPGVPLNRCP